MSCFRSLCKSKGSRSNSIEEVSIYNSIADPEERSEPICNTDPKKLYNVYLSFCSDKDVVDSYVSNMYTGLCREAGVSVFWEEQRLGGGDWVITPSTLNVIEECKVAIIVFSRNYAESICCLQELEKIVDCCRTTGLMLLTFFYVEVENPTNTGGLFGKGFYDLVDRISTAKISEDKFMSWVALINKATLFSARFDENLIIETMSGYHWIDEEIHILDLVRIVSCGLQKKDLSITCFPTGAMSRAQHVIRLLSQKQLLLLGIWGMTGIGKTTLAIHIYNLISPYFEANDFVEAGHYIHIRMFQRKRLLLILDGVTKLEELNFLHRSREWLREGSKIIITTRDRHLLKVHGVDHIYKLRVLDQQESLEVFNKHAFKHGLQKECVELSRQFTACLGGLPLALAKLGPILCGNSIKFWKDHLVQLKRVPTRVLHMQEHLQSTLNDLNVKEREMFFDIACFFIEMKQEDLLRIIEKSTQFTISQISVLEDKSLVTIDDNNKLGMHFLVQAMAREAIMMEQKIFSKQKIFDVFLSFRGDDSRAKFISHLYSSFQNAAIYVFKDDDEIQRGDQISMSLFQAIGQSRIFTIVLSTNYAKSRWCMLELERIMKDHRTRGTVILPVFYEVDPSEVRNQTGIFGKAFNDLISTISMDEFIKENWRRDLHEVGSIAGFVIINSRNESADINNIVRHVTRLLDREELFIAEHPVGVEPRVQIATNLLHMQNSDGVQVVTKLLSIQKPKDVLLLGIWGMGGMGKTTIAKATYNKIGRQFEGRSFLLDIRETWEKCTNRVSLQQLILCDVYKTAAWKIRDIESGKAILEERLAQKRVLVVLDDVNELEQLKALCGSRKWFGPGSRIIITTRDLHLLRSCGVDHVYTIKEMDESESLELFSWHAFKQASPKEDFTIHSRNVVNSLGRLPLALQVLGSYLFNRGIKEWERLLEKLKRIPNYQVQKKLKLSFDDLSDDTQKQIFLDIACFFIGMDRNDVIQILNGCHFFADIGVNVLIERSLVMVDNKNKLRMHDLLKIMGREIVREESPYDPEKRSRLWFCEEVLGILSKNKGTENVKGIALELPKQNAICLNTKAFKKMNKLRLLKLAGVQLNGDFKYLSEDLRWMCWHGFPSTYIPEEFQQASLVSIQLKNSNLKQIWRESQMLENLKSLNLSHSQDLATTPDFSYLPNLEKPVLKDCPSLSVVSHTIGSLHKLLLINLTDCKSLQELPRSIYTLKHLETLILSGCLMIEKLEEDIEQMESLITLVADRTGIKKVPFSIVRSKNIGYISLCGFEGFSRNVFPSLIQSWMSPKNNVVSLFHTSTSISSPVSLDFPYGTFNDLLKLRSLCVECGTELQLTIDVERILDALKAINYQKSEASTSSTTSKISDMCSPPSIGLSHVSLKSFSIHMGMKCEVPNMVKGSIFKSVIDGIENPYWLTFSCKGCSLIFEVPKMKGHNMKRMVLGIDYTSSLDNETLEDFQGILFMNYAKTTIQLYKTTTLTSFEEEEWQSITSNLEPGNKVEVKVVFGEGFIVEKTTLSLLYDEPNNKDFENSHALNKEDVIVSGDDAETSNHSNSHGEENQDDREEETFSQIQKIDTISEDGSKTLRRIQIRKEDSSTYQSEKQKLSIRGQLENTNILSRKKIETEEESSGNSYLKGQADFSKKTLVASMKKLVADIKKDDQCSCGFLPLKGVVGESDSRNSNLSHLDDFRKMLDIDPLAVMEHLLPSEVATSQIEFSALEDELEKLRQIAFSDKLFEKLLNNQELQSTISASIQHIKARYKDLNSQHYNGFFAFSMLFSKAIECINAGNFVSYHLSQLEYEEKEAITELQSIRNEIKQETKRMAEIEAQSRQTKDQNVLEETYTSCKVKHEEAINRGRDISLNVISIREKIEGYKNQERENNAKYAELIDSYERMKVSPPF